jgi:hypothetical protein
MVAALGAGSNIPECPASCFTIHNVCGIEGIVNHSSGRSGSADTLHRMRDRMTHRGPDDCGIHIARDRCASLAHRRLSIVDWFKSELGDLMRRKLLAFSDRQPYFSRSQIEKLLATSSGALPWYLFNFALWHEVWIEDREFD